MTYNISIIIPAHNEENYIRKTLHSIKNQTYQDYEVIVIANGCTDKTEEIIMKRSNDKVKLFSMSQAHVSRARNYGADKAEGKILLFLDADTCLDIDSLQKINQHFTENYSIATTLVKSDNKKFQFLMNLKNFHNKTGLYKGCSGALICRKEDFNVVNGYNSDIVVKEHRKLTQKLLKSGKYVCINTNVTTSMRRFNDWGLIKVGSFWMKQLVKDKFGDLTKSDYEKIR